MTKNGSKSLLENASGVGLGNLLGNGSGLEMNKKAALGGGNEDLSSLLAQKPPPSQVLTSARNTLLHLLNTH